MPSWALTSFFAVCWYLIGVVCRLADGGLTAPNQSFATAMVPTGMVGWVQMLTWDFACLQGDYQIVAWILRLLVAAFVLRITIYAAEKAISALSGFLRAVRP